MRLLAVFLLALIVSSPAHAQTQYDRVQAAIDERADRIDEINADIADGDADLLSARAALRAMRRDALDDTKPVRAAAGEAKSDLERLGAPPEEGAPPEIAPVAAERSRLNTSISRMNGAVRQSDLNIAEIDRLLLEIAEKRRGEFLSRLVARGPSVLSPTAWRSALVTVGTGYGSARRSVAGWLDEKRNAQNLQASWFIIGWAIIIALAMFIPVRGWLDRMINNRIAGWTPTASRRVLIAAARTTARVIPGLIGGYIVYEAFRHTGVIVPGSEGIGRALWFSVVALLLVDAAIAGVAALRAPDWRVVNLNTSQVRRIRFLAFFAALVLVAEAVLTQGAYAFGDSRPLLMMIASAVAVILAITLWALCRSVLWRAPVIAETALGDVGASKKSRWPEIRLAGKVFALLAVVLAVVGYVALSHFLMTRIFLLLGLAALIWLLRSLLRETVRVFDKKFTHPNNVKGESESVLYFWVGVTIDAIAILAFIPPALLLLGAEWVDVRDTIIDAFVGFRIGSIQISIINIASAVLTFVVLLYVTRLFQRTAETRLFPKTRMDIGVQNSLKTLIGYVGLVAAFVIGVGTLGFDLSNLAIIAGALSVGIGFGLQSIVNNFVSGLILLFERPVKVGDWIVTTSGEGIVKRISVRSTEIETFDRSSVIIPNSELISSAVVNWTHKDKIGRVIVPIGVGYNADPQHVIEVLTEVANDHPKILTSPPPFIYFKDFADSSINFELRGFIRDVSQSIYVRSEVRAAIFSKLREVGIEIPFPQRDIHIKTGDNAEASPEKPVTS